jgi:hypothetical protein
MKRIGIICAALALSSYAHAAECEPIVAAKKSVTDKGGSWIDLTPEQVLFMKGAFFNDPHTRDGLPYGDKAALISNPDEALNVVAFIDGDEICDRINVPRPSTHILIDVGSGAITHHPKEPIKGEQNP